MQSAARSVPSFSAWAWNAPFVFRKQLIFELEFADGLKKTLLHHAWNRRWKNLRSAW